MNYIRRVLNDSKELAKVFIVFSIADLLLTLWYNYDYLFYYAEAKDIIQFIVGLLPLIYFICIQTKCGKRNFKTLNLILSCVLMLDFVYYGYLIVTSYIPYFVQGVDMSSVVGFLSYLVAMAFDLYFVSVFILKDNYKIKIYKNRMINENIHIGIILGYTIVTVASFVYYMVNMFTSLDFSYLIMYFIELFIFLVLCVLQTRYVYLYQKFKEGR